MCVCVCVCVCVWLLEFMNFYVNKQKMQNKFGQVCKKSNFLILGIIANFMIKYKMLEERKTTKRIGKMTPS